MLSRNNKILVGCLALLLAMSVGYALFSDTITINGSATAKGDFEITTEVIDLNQDIYSHFTDGDVSSGVVENPTISVVDNKVSSSVTFGAPGSHHYFGIKVKNTGSIPATLNSVVDKTNNYTIVDKNVESGISFTPWYDSDGEVELQGEMLVDDGWIMDYDSNDFPAESRTMNGYIERDMLDAVLDPGEEVYFVFYYFWNSKSEENSENIEKLDWTLEFNWEQITS